MYLLLLCFWLCYCDRPSCSRSDNQTAMLFSDSEDIGALQELTVTWESREESHDQVLAHGLTQLTIRNVTVQYGGHRYIPFTQPTDILVYMNSSSC
mgnify:FL=1